MQEESQKIIREYISKAPKSIKELVASDTWEDSVIKIAGQFKIEETKIEYLKNEVLFVLIGMEPSTDFKENVSRELGLDTSVAEQIAAEIEKNIFSKVVKEIEEFWKNNIEPEKPAVAPTSGVGGEFEQIILNQAKAMRPARPTDESGRIMNHELGIMNKKEEIPQNLPTEQPSEAPRAIHNYIGGSDPYREPPE